MTPVTERRVPFLITIDTEGDNLWSKPRTITTENAHHLPRFQRLCERHGMRPTWLTNWEMACDPAFQEFGRDVLARGAGEIGMHLHAWNTPPLVPLTPDDFTHMPYLMEYPEDVMREKIARMTDLLEVTFGAPMRSHRAGRWGFDARIARLIAARGYRTDCSVTPHVSWRGERGAPQGEGGPDFRGFPENPYLLDLDCIGRPGNSGLLEVPVTIAPCGGATRRRLHVMFRGVRPARRALNLLLPQRRWLRPNGRNRAAMLRMVREGVASGATHLMFMTHSSELMPGGGPYFATARAIDSLFDDLEALFALASDRCAGMTLSEFTEKHLAESKL